MKKYMIILICTILLVFPLLAAETIYLQNRNIDLKVPFEVDGKAASNISTCNISIIHPNSTYITNTSVMTNENNGEFSHTVNFAEVTDLGIYKWNAYCCDVDKCASGFGKFEITATGDTLSTGESIVYVIFLIGIIFAFLLCLYGATKIPFRNVRSQDGHIIQVNDLKYVKIICIVFCYLLLMFMFGVTRSVLANYLFLNGAYKVFNWLFWILFSFVWPLIVVSLLLTLVYYIDGKKLKKALMRGVPIR